MGLPEARRSGVSAMANDRRLSVALALLWIVVAVIGCTSLFQRLG